jgi:hypothetical protein
MFARTVMLVVVVIAGTACFGGDFNPLEEDPEEAGITIDVIACEHNADIGTITATFELSSTEEYSTVLVNGEATDESGVVIATSSTSVINVRPGRTYRESMVLSTPATPPEGDVACEVTLDFANPL